MLSIFWWKNWPARLHLKVRSETIVNSAMTALCFPFQDTLQSFVAFGKKYVVGALSRVGWDAKPDGMLLPCIS
jgi:hypothetical protein